MLVQIKMNDGETFEVTIENYSAEALAEKINDRASNVIAIGNMVIQKHAVIRIMPVQTTQVQ